MAIALPHRPQQLHSAWGAGFGPHLAGVLAGGQKAFRAEAEGNADPFVRTGRDAGGGCRGHGPCLEGEQQVERLRDELAQGRGCRG